MSDIIQFIGFKISNIYFIITPKQDIALVTHLACRQLQVEAAAVFLYQFLEA